MKRIALILVVLAGVATTMAFNTPKEENIAVADKTESIEFFNGTFAQALEASKKQNKPIFMDSYTSWCHWCKHLDKTTFKDAKVISYLNENFINVKMNMEAGEGPKLAQKYRVSGYPTLLFINSEGEAIGRIGGYVKATAFVKNAKKAKNAFN
jgi:thiol:disulfide interchange protein